MITRGVMPGKKRPQRKISTKHSMRMSVGYGGLARGCGGKERKLSVSVTDGKL